MEGLGSCSRWARRQKKEQRRRQKRMRTRMRRVVLLLIRKWVVERSSAIGRWRKQAGARIVMAVPCRSMDACEMQQQQRC